MPGGPEFSLPAKAAQAPACRPRRRGGLSLGAVLLAFMAVLVLGGCRKQVPLLAGSQVAGYSVEGRPIEILELGNGPDVVMVMATIHGNEHAGTPLVQRLAQILRSRPDLLNGKKVVLMPALNPDGLVRNVRTNVHGIDLNRNFPSANRQNTRRYGQKELSEPESRTIMAMLEKYRPSRVVTIHQPLKCVDWDGTASIPLARHMAKYCPLPVRQVGTRPGSLGAMMGVDMGVPIITYELPKSATGLHLDDLWRQYGVSLLAAVRYPENVDALTEEPKTAAGLAILVAAGIIGSLIGLLLYDRRRYR